MRRLGGQNRVTENRLTRARLQKGFEGSSYLEIYTALCKIKQNAMAQDFETNQSRWRWFMLNRSGNSRFFTMLTHMQTQVLGAWAKHYKQQFKDYDTEFKGDFKAHRQAFSNAFHKFEEPCEHGLFTSAARKRAIRALREVLGGEPEPFIKVLKTHQANLPGHLRALAKEVLKRGEVLGEAPKPQPPA